MSPGARISHMVRYVSNEIKTVEKGTRGIGVRPLVPCAGMVRDEGSDPYAPCPLFNRLSCNQRDLARFQREREDVIDGLHGVKTHLLANIGRQIVQVRFIAFRKD